MSLEFEIRPAAVVVLLCMFPAAVAAQADGRVAQAPGVAVIVPEPFPAPASLRSALETEVSVLEPLARLVSAEEGAHEALEDLRAWNLEPNRPLRIGLLRALPEPGAIALSVRDLAPPTSAGVSLRAGGILTVDPERIVWAAAVEVEDADALRARLRVDAWPDGARLWTRGEDGAELGPYGVELLAEDGSLWLPPVRGPRVMVEVSVPRAALAAGQELRARLEDVMELVDPDGGNILRPAAAVDCEIDGRCVDSGTLSVIDDYRHAVARLVFTKGSFAYLCSGSLINDTDASSEIPYLLTANHCFSDQAAATSLVAYFDYFTATCDGTSPPVGSLPQVSGSTLLATGTTSDFTLVELSTLPAGYNYFLGWTDRALVEHEILYMLSHPEGRRQAFSTSEYTTVPNLYCGTFSGIFYAEQVAGTTLGGSSGAPVIVEENGGQIVGQLYGACASTPDDCDYSTFTEVDGAFRTTYASVAPWLDPDLPDLTVEAPDPSASEPVGKGTFRISRAGATVAPAEVTVSVGGTATAGADFRAIPSPVTIPAGEATVDVKVTPIDDAGDEGSETVVLTLVSSPGYEIGSPSEATIDLSDDEGPDCRSVVVADQELADGDASACDRLHAGPDLAIASGGDTAFHAGRAVAFYDGFSTAPGARLSVATCGVALCSAGSAVPSSSACHPCVVEVCAADASCCDTAWGASCVAAVGSVCGLTCP